MATNYGMFYENAPPSYSEAAIGPQLGSAGSPNPQVGAQQTGAQPGSPFSPVGAPNPYLSGAPVNQHQSGFAQQGNANVQPVVVTHLSPQGTQYSPTGAPGGPTYPPVGAPYAHPSEAPSIQSSPAKFIKHGSAKVQPIVVSQPQMMQTQRQPNGANDAPDYMPAAILVAFCCVPFGIIAIINASKCRSAKERGDSDNALKYSKKARLMVILGIVFGMIAIVALSIQLVTLSSLR